jgi:GNAT superfamily N-acetyltransferase
VGQRRCSALHLQARPVSANESKAFNQTLKHLHYAGACYPVGRFLRLMVFERDSWVGGFVLRGTIPHVTCRDKFFGLYRFRRRGRFPAARSGYWRRLNEIVNIGRIFVFPEFQGMGIGAGIVRLASSCSKTYWKNMYDAPVRGLDCLDLAPPQHARIFTDNGWQFLGLTTGHSRDGRAPSMGQSKSARHKKLPSLSKIHRPWYVYGTFVN